jgi:hypothetical protein
LRFRFPGAAAGAVIFSSISRPSIFFLFKKSLHWFRQCSKTIDIEVISCRMACNKILPYGVKHG